MSNVQVAIIGGGFSGACLALQLMRQGGVGVTLIDRSGRFGTGLAYSTPHPAHLLNVRASRMSAVADAPADFTDWLRDKPGQEGADEWFAPRAAYGVYLQDRIVNALQGVAMMHDDVVSVRVEGTGVAVECASGAQMRADVAVLAWGTHLAPPPAPFDHPAYADIVRANPWDSDAIATVAADRDVLVLGAGLTAVDMVMSLTQRPRDGRIFALSRHGLTPQPHCVAPKGPLAPLNLAPQLSDALQALRREARAAEARDEPWQWIMDRLRPETQRLWRALPTAAQQRFLRHARPWWDAHRHRMAPHLHARIAALQDSGDLRVLAGRVTALSRVDDTARVSWRARGRRVSQTINVAAVINCTGARHRLDAIDHPLARQLRDEGVVRAHACGLGLDIADDARVIGADGSASDRIYALGPPTIGALWETMAIPEIRVRAQALAEILAQRLH